MSWPRPQLGGHRLDAGVHTVHGARRALLALNWTDDTAAWAMRSFELAKFGRLIADIATIQTAAREDG